MTAEDSQATRQEPHRIHLRNAKTARKSLLSFVRAQLTQVRDGGWPVLRFKVQKLIGLLVVPLAVPVVLVIRLLRRFGIVVRFARLVSARIGHFSANTEVYLCERDAGIGMPAASVVDVWYYESRVCNVQLKRMWARKLNVWPTPIAAPIDRVNRLLPGGEPHMIPWRIEGHRDVHNVLERFPPHLSFLPHEEDRGEAGLRAMGVPDGAPFVCFHSRDSAYLRAVDPRGDWSYHDYRDSSIHNYVMAAEELTRLGYCAIRMGAVVAEPLKIENPRIIDYATNGHRSDFMDIYLGARCAFFISSGTGIDGIPEIFRRPIMFVNFLPVEGIHSWNATGLFIFKKHWLSREGRVMTFREIIESGAGRFRHSHVFEEHAVEVIENTPEEIAALAIEMDARLEGRWETTEEDEYLQRRFWALFPRSELHGTKRSRIGADFIRRNSMLLE